jgi:hypothetical protein
MSSQSLNARLGRVTMTILVVASALVAGGCAVQVDDGTVDDDETAAEYNADAPTWNESVGPHATRSVAYDTRPRRVATGDDPQEPGFAAMSDNQAGDKGSDGDGEDNPDPTPWLSNPDPTPWHQDTDSNTRSDPDPQPWRE